MRVTLECGTCGKSVVPTEHYGLPWGREDVLLFAGLCNCGAFVAAGLGPDEGVLHYLRSLDRRLRREGLRLTSAKG